MAGCRGALAADDLVLALLDGTQVDDGTAWELGYAYARNITVMGIRTDTRYCCEATGDTINAFIAGACQYIRPGMRRSSRSKAEILDNQDARLFNHQVP